jgi:hypothetical protein
MLQVWPLKELTVLKGRIASIIGVERISDLGTMLGVTSTDNIVLIPMIFSTLMIMATRSSETSVLTKATRATSQATVFFIATALKSSNLT